MALRKVKCDIISGNHRVVKRNVQHEKSTLILSVTQRSSQQGSLYCFLKYRCILLLKAMQKIVWCNTIWMINGMHFSLHFSSLLNSYPFHSTCQIQTHIHSHMAAAWDASSGAIPISQRSQPYLLLYNIYPESQFGVQYLQHASSVWLCPKHPVCHRALLLMPQLALCLCISGLCSYTYWYMPLLHSHLETSLVCSAKENAFRWDRKEDIWFM